MTFEEWFEDRYGSKPDVEHDSYAQVAHAAWEASSENLRMKEMSVEDSWNRLQEAIALAGSPKIKSIEMSIDNRTQMKYYRK
jgi:hypothetical protein